MARINYPEEFLKQTDLFYNLKKKHDADGGTSVLHPFLSEQGIHIDKDKSDTDKAIAKNKLFEEAEKEAEDHTQDRNTLFDPAFDQMTDGFQFLKKLYRGNPAELGHWGATINKNAIVYPPDFLKRVELFKTFKAKHDSYPGGSSPLAPFLTVNAIDLGDDATDVTAAKAKHKLAKQTEKDAEDLREERDNLFDPVMAHIRGMGQYLKGLYVEHPKHLGQWSYTVDDSPQAGREASLEIAPHSTRTVKRLVNGSLLTNTGMVELILHKGEGTHEEGVTLLPADVFNIAWGFGTTTIENTHSSEAGTVTGFITS